MKLSLFIALLLCSLISSAQPTWTSIDNGDWDDPDTWSGASGAPPYNLSSSESVIITNLYQVVATQEIILDDNSSLTIQGDGVLQMGDKNDPAPSFSMKSSGCSFTISDGIFFNYQGGSGGNFTGEKGTVSWTNALMYTSGNYLFKSEVTLSLNNVCLRSKQNHTYEGVGTSGSPAVFNNVYIYSGTAGSGNIDISSNSYINYTGSNHFILGESDSKLTIKSSTVTGAIFSIAAKDLDIDNSVSGCTLDVYCVSGSSSGISNFAGPKVNDCATTEAQNCSGLLHFINGTVFNDPNQGIINGTATGVFSGTQMFVSAVLKSGPTIIQTVPVNSDGTYLLTSLQPSLFDLVLHTTASGSLTSQLPTNYINSAEGIEPELIFALPNSGDGTPDGVVEVDLTRSVDEDNVEFALYDDRLKWIGTQWVNGSSVNIPGHPSNADAGRTAYILNEEDPDNNPTVARLEESATLADLVFENDFSGTPHGLDINSVVSTGNPGSGACLTITNSVSNQGDVRLLSKSDSEYGQYIGPSIDATYQMTLEEGWHNLGIPFTNVSALGFQAENDLGVVDLSGTQSHNLFFYESKRSGGNEIGFEVGAYSSHAFGSWLPVPSVATDLSNFGLNFFLDGGLAPSNPYVLEVSGTINNSSKSFNTHNNWGGWNLIPNIYTSTIDVTLMQANGFFGSDFDEAAWIWDPSGTYVVLDAITGIGVNINVDNFGAILVSDVEIAPMQSFFIRRTNSNLNRRQDADVSINANLSEGSTNDPFFGVSAFIASDLSVTMSPSFQTDCQSSVGHYKTNNVPDLMLLGVYDLDNTDLTDAIEIVFGEEYSLGFDLGSDILKLGNSESKSPILFTHIGESPLVIQKRPYPLNTEVIPLAFKSTKTNGKYQLGFAEKPIGWSIYLEDKLLKEWHDLGKSDYLFENVSYSSVDRFNLHFNKTGKPIQRVNAAPRLWMDSEGVRIVFNGIDDERVNIQILNSMGQILHYENNVSTEKELFIPFKSNNKGIYVIYIQGVSYKRSFKVNY
ncbi:MAG: hypothetical protein N4A46_07815 [Schleiferiaceae bacterium]|nr:hypothetical protein [Schleiferiaceae bacterium]